MRIGLLLEPQPPRPWEPGEARDRLAETLLTLAALAEELGLASVWVQEHAVVGQAGRGGGAVTLLEALAARTSRVRLGLCVLNVDPQLRDLAALAADAATLDALTAGRIQVATGVTPGGAEGTGMGLARQAAHSAWEHGTRDLAHRLTTDGSGSAPPPLWARADRPAGISGAARLGLGALCRALMEPDEAGEWIAEYRGVLASASCVPVGAAVEGRVAVCLPMSVHADEATAIVQGLDAAHFAAFAAAHFERFGEHVPDGIDPWAAFAERREDVGLSPAAVVADGTPLSVRVLRDGRAGLRGAIGTPAQVAELVGRYAAAGVDDLLLLVPAGRPQDHAATCASLRLFAEAVLPTVPADPDRPDLDVAIRAALERRPLEPVAVPDVAPVVEAPVIAATPAPPAVAVPAPQRSRRWRERLVRRGAVAVGRAVGRTDDRWIERTLGSAAGLRLIFTAMGSRFVPEAAGGFVGTITYELRRARGGARCWSVGITPTGATAVPGTVPDPALTVLLGVADFVRVAVGEEDPARLLLSGKMDLRGDFSLATRLGPMFGL